MTTDARVKADNADWLASTGGLCLADALAIHDAIHSSTASVTLSGFGQTMRVFRSPGNGCRRCDVIVDPSERPAGRCKLMEQNKSSGSKAAERASQGAKITWIIPLDAQGRHTPPATGWGKIEDGVLKPTCKAVIADVQASKKAAKKPPPPAAAPAPKKQKVDADEATAVGRKMRLAGDGYTDPAQMGEGLSWDDIIVGMTGKERTLWIKATSAFEERCAAARRAGESGGIGKLHVAAADHLNGLLKLGGAYELALARQPGAKQAPLEVD